MRCYKNFDELYFESEMEGIMANNDVIHVKYDPNKEDIIFLLGILFASGKRIQVDNLSDVKNDNSLITELVKHWHEKKASLQIPTNINAYNYNSFFLFSPRHMDDKEEIRIRGLVEQEKRKGYEVRTSSYISDSIYGLCKQNAIGIACSNNIYMYYNRNSRAHVFDLGMIYYFSYLNRNRSFRLLNEDSLNLDLNDFSDRVVHKMVQDQKARDDLFNRIREIA